MKRHIVLAIICMLCTSMYAHAAGQPEQVRELTLLKQPVPQDPASSAFNATGPAPPKIGWHCYAVEAYVGEYYYDATSFAVNKSLGIVTVNVRIEESSHVLERPERSYDGEAWIDLSKGTLYKNISFQDIDAQTGELKTREQRKYGMESDTEKGLLIAARRWAIDHIKTNPEAAKALAPIGPLHEKWAWHMYAHAPWAAYYYAPNSMAFSSETGQIVLTTRIESTEYGRKPSVIKVLHAQGVENDFKVKTSQTVADLERQELMFVDYYMTLDDVATTPSEGIPVPKNTFSKDQKKLFEMVTTWAKAHFKENPTDRRDYKATYPRSKFIR